ncbi:MAG: hypothetical protein QOI23_1893, partial [Chloroflexota bacterium]|nr:hypothetical protein [Chloroflexota bacterium]
METPPRRDRVRSGEKPERYRGQGPPKRGSAVPAGDKPARRPRPVSPGGGERGQVGARGERPDRGPRRSPGTGGREGGQAGTYRRPPAVEREVSKAPLIYGRNAVLEAARAGRVLKVLQASGLGHDPRLEE